MSSDEDKVSLVLESGEASEPYRSDTEEPAALHTLKGDAEEGEDYAEWKRRRKSKKKKKQKGEGEKSEGASAVVVARKTKLVDINAKRDFQVEQIFN